MCQSFFTCVCVDKEGGKGRYLCARKIFLSYNNRTYVVVELSLYYYLHDCIWEWPKVFFINTFSVPILYALINSNRFLVVFSNKLFHHLASAYLLALSPLYLLLLLRLPTLQTYTNMPWRYCTFVSRTL